LDCRLLADRFPADPADDFASINCPTAPGPLILWALWRFPEGFLQGEAASVHLIEGAYNGDGRAETIWSDFTR
jgi:hypothetical protein